MESYDPRRHASYATPDATHWITRLVADHLGIDKSTVQRVWEAHELAPRRVHPFKLSRDKPFVEKLVDVMGLYLRPPENALVLSVARKSQTPASDRTQPELPLTKGHYRTMTHDYRRNGTTTRSGALKAASGKLTGTCLKRHRRQEWFRASNKTHCGEFSHR